MYAAFKTKHLVSMYETYFSVIRVYAVMQTQPAGPAYFSYSPLHGGIGIEWLDLTTHNHEPQFCLPLKRWNTFV